MPTKLFYCIFDLYLVLKVHCRRKLCTDTAKNLKGGFSEEGEFSERGEIKRPLILKIGILLRARGFSENCTPSGGGGKRKVEAAHHFLYHYCRGYPLTAPLLPPPEIVLLGWGILSPLVGVMYPVLPQPLISPVRAIDPFVPPTFERMHPIHSRPPPPPN